jgi:hypothetical protein
MKRRREEQRQRKGKAEEGRIIRVKKRITDPVLRTHIHTHTQDKHTILCMSYVYLTYL